MIGIDLVKISRFENKIEKEAFVKRILGKDEQKEFYMLSDKAKVIYLAKVFSVKEACFKASQSKKNFNEYNLIKVNMVPKIKEEPTWNISISHDDGYVIAIATTSVNVDLANVSIPKINK